mgnify:CR=1 FL=1
MTAPRILTLYSSGRTTQSASRELADLLSITLAGETGVITTRDLVAQPLPFVDEAFVDASFTRLQPHRGASEGAGGLHRCAG